MKICNFLRKCGFIVIGLIIFAHAALAETGKHAAADTSSMVKHSFTLWQLPAQTAGQMNSYVLRTANNRIIVIDGGYAEDAGYLKGFLAAIGNHVDMWFVSHQHPDHIDALTAMLEKPADLKIEAIYGSLLEEQWIQNGEPSYLKTAVAFNEALKKAQRQVTELELGQVLKIDGITIEILGIKNPELAGINNSSIVMKVWDSKKSILFTNDLGVEGGNKILAGPYKDRLKSDYVQMAHHGQKGVSEIFYRTVNPTYCIWPTPLWLWDNDNGGGKGSGPWKTLEVRAWMDKLSVQQHYCLFEGLIMIQ
jgi:beta-lactamase superfamily II metal-dependent hydrolase